MSFFKKYIQFYYYNPDYDDEDLEEVIAYHGARNLFNKYEIHGKTKTQGASYGKGAYLTSDPKEASKYASKTFSSEEIPNVHIYNIDNLKLFNVKKDNKSAEKLISFLGIKDVKFQYDWFEDILTSLKFEEKYKDLNPLDQRQKIAEAIVEIGFDGIEVPNNDKSSDFATWYIVYNLNKLKHQYAKENIEEVTAYHGTTKAFDKFTTGKHTGKIGGIYGYGAYLTDKPEVASDYAGGLKDKYPKGSSVHIYNLDNLKFWDVYNSKQNSLIAKELGITEKISTMDVDGYHAIKKAMDSEISDDKKKELITKAVVKAGFDGLEFPQAKKETQYVVYNIEKLKHKFAESAELTEQPNIAQSAPIPPPAPQGMNQPPNPEKANQKRKQMGVKANSWLKSFGRIMPNVSRELQTGNMGQNASQFFTMLAQMPKQDWYRYYFKQ